MIVVPDILGYADSSTERFLDRLAERAVPGEPHLELGAITWVCPYGAVLLAGACHYLARHHGTPVTLAGLRPDTYAYLQRIDFFEQTAECIRPCPVPAGAELLSRSPASTNVLELVSLASLADVSPAVVRARHILEYWLTEAEVDIGRIVTMLAEACGNVAAHSGDIGWLAIQKYDHGSAVNVELAIGDLGLGIPGTLRATHGPLAPTSSGYILEALNGRSSRPEGGGQGLATICGLATASGGWLHIRSETGRLSAYPNGRLSMADDLAFFPGTQVGIRFWSRT